MDSFLGSQSNPRFSFDAVLKQANLDGPLRQHLSRVYVTLAFAVLSAAVGAFAHLSLNIGGILSTLAVIGLMMVLATERGSQDNIKRTGILCALGFFKGASIGPLIAHAVSVDPSLVTSAFLGTTVAFVCFSLSALFSSRQSMMYLGGLLSSALSIMLILSLFSLFFPSVLIFNLYLYLGLVVFCGYIVFDTQMIITKFQVGEKDYVWHAMELFIDFVAVFVRILIILMKNSKKEDNRRRR